MKRTRYLLPAYFFIVFPIILCAFMTGCGPRKVASGIAARYPNLKFVGDSDTFSEVYSGYEKSHVKVAPLWLRLKDGEVIELATISEDRVRLWDYHVRNGTDFPGAHTVGGGSPEKRIYGVDLGTGGATFTFVDGRLRSCCLRESYRSPLEGVQIGPSKTGEFLSFPIKHEDLIRVFGKPDSIGVNWIKAPSI